MPIKGIYVINIINPCPPSALSPGCVPLRFKSSYKRTSSRSWRNSRHLLRSSFQPFKRYVFPNHIFLSFRIPALRHPARCLHACNVLHPGSVRGSRRCVIYIEATLAVSARYQIVDLVSQLSRTCISLDCSCCGGQGNISGPPSVGATPLWPHADSVTRTPQYLVRPTPFSFWGVYMSDPHKGEGSTLTHNTCN